MTDERNIPEHQDTEEIQRRHLKFGWWGLTAFVLLGISLEGLHAFKTEWYLDPGFETRRLLWRLAHAHGTLLSVVQIAFAASVPFAWPKGNKGIRLTSTLVLLATLFLPAGFFLGGITIYGGDPGPGIFLAPVGAACLLLGAARTAWAVTSQKKSK